MRHFASKFLPGETNEVGARDHGEVRDGEDEDMVAWQRVYVTGQVGRLAGGLGGTRRAKGERLTSHSQSSGHDRPEKAAYGAGRAARATGDANKVPRVKTAAAALAGGPDGDRA